MPPFDPYRIEAKASRREKARTVPGASAASLVVERFDNFPQLFRGVRLASEAEAPSAEDGWPIEAQALQELFLKGHSGAAEWLTRGNRVLLSDSLGHLDIASPISGIPVVARLTELLRYAKNYSGTLLGVPGGDEGGGGGGHGDDGSGELGAAATSARGADGRAAQQLFCRFRRDVEFGDGLPDRAPIRDTGQRANSGQRRCTLFDEHVGNAPTREQAALLHDGVVRELDVKRREMQNKPLPFERVPSVHPGRTAAGHGGSARILREAGLQGSEICDLGISLRLAWTVVGRAEEAREANLGGGASGGSSAVPIAPSMRAATLTWIAEDKDFLSRKKATARVTLEVQLRDAAEARDALVTAAATALRNLPRPAPSNFFVHRPPPPEPVSFATLDLEAKMRWEELQRNPPEEKRESTLAKRWAIALFWKEKAFMTPTELYSLLPEYEEGKKIINYDTWRGMFTKGNMDKPPRSFCGHNDKKGIYTLRFFEDCGELGIIKDKYNAKEDEKAKLKSDPLRGDVSLGAQSVRDAVGLFLRHRSSGGRRGGGGGRSSGDGGGANTRKGGARAAAATAAEELVLARAATVYILDNQDKHKNQTKAGSKLMSATDVAREALHLTRFSSTKSDAVKDFFKKYITEISAPEDGAGSDTDDDLKPLVSQRARGDLVFFGLRKWKGEPGGWKLERASAEWDDAEAKAVTKRLAALEKDVAKAKQEDATAIAVAMAAMVKAELAINSLALEEERAFLLRLLPRGPRAEATASVAVARCSRQGPSATNAAAPDATTTSTGPGVHAGPSTSHKAGIGPGGAAAAAGSVQEEMVLDPQLPSAAAAASAGTARSPSPYEDSADDELPSPSPQLERHARVELNRAEHVLQQTDEKERIGLHVTQMFDFAALLDKRRPERLRKEAVAAAPAAAPGPSPSWTSTALPGPEGATELDPQVAAPAARATDVATAASDPKGGAAQAAPAAPAASPSSSTISDLRYANLLRLFHATCDAIEERCVALAAPLLVGKSLSVYGELHGLPPLDLGRGALGVPTLSGPAHAIGMLLGEMRDKELAAEAQKARAMSWMDPAEWKEELFSELKRSEMPEAATTTTTATASRSTDTGPVILLSDHLHKLASVLELFISPGSVVWKLWEGAAAGSLIRVAVKAIAAVLGKEDGASARASDAEALPTIPIEGGVVIDRLNEGARCLSVGLGSRENAVELLFTLTQDLQEQCVLRKELLGLVLLAPSSLTPRLFVEFLSSALSKQLLFDFSRFLSDGKDPGLEKGLPFETMMLILSLAPYSDLEAPFALVLLRAALIDASDIICWLKTDDAAKRLVRLLFPFSSPTGDAAEKFAEANCESGLVRATGRSSLSRMVAGRCAIDEAALAEVAPKVPGSVLLPGYLYNDSNLYTGHAQLVALAASEGPMTSVMRWWSSFRQGMVLVVPDEDRIRLSFASEEEFQSVSGGDDASKLLLDRKCGGGGATGAESAGAAGSLGGDGGGGSSKRRRVDEKRHRLFSAAQIYKKERERAAAKSFDSSSPDSVFVSANAAGGGGRDLLSAVQRAFDGIVSWPGPPGAEEDKGPSVVLMDEAFGTPNKGGFRFGHSAPDSRRAGGNGQLLALSNSSPVLGGELCSVNVVTGVESVASGGSGGVGGGVAGGDVSEARVFCCHLAVLSGFQVALTSTSLAKTDVDKPGENKFEDYVEAAAAAAAREKAAASAAVASAAEKSNYFSFSSSSSSSSAGVEGFTRDIWGAHDFDPDTKKLLAVCVNFHGCAPCGRVAGYLARRLTGTTARCVTRSTDERTQLAAPADWNKCGLDPFDQSTMISHFFQVLYGARPSLKDVSLKFLRSFAGCGGAPRETRSIDGRYLWSSARGEPRPRLGYDAVKHVSIYGHVEHSTGTDHGALRWSALPPRVSSEVVAAGADEPTPRDISGPFFELLAPSTGRVSLSNVPLTDIDKARIELFAARSRNHEFHKRKRLRIWGSDVSGLGLELWGSALVVREKRAWVKLGETDAEAERLAQATADAGSSKLARTKKAPALLADMEVDGNEGEKEKEAEKAGSASGDIDESVEASVDADAPEEGEDDEDDAPSETFAFDLSEF